MRTLVGFLPVRFAETQNSLSCMHLVRGLQFSAHPTLRGEDASVSFFNEPTPPLRRGFLFGAHDTTSNPLKRSGRAPGRKGRGTGGGAPPPALLSVQNLPAPRPGARAQPFGFGGFTPTIRSPHPVKKIQRGHPTGCYLITASFPVQLATNS